ncbi:MAG: AAA family ATPase [Bacteroidales bacterium]|nr:AAA family ATPase [Bacteroidales bacterium]
MEKSSIEFYVEDLIPKGALIALTGSSDMGKSMFCRQLVLSLSLGATHFIGRKIKSFYQKCLYISSEDTENITAEYCFRQVQALFPNEYGTDKTREEASLRYRNKDVGFIFEQDNFELFIRSLKGCNYGIIVVDALADFIPKDLNSAIEVRKFLSMFKPLTAEGTSVIFVTHINKASEERRPSKSNMNGSEALQSGVREVLYLSDAGNGLRKLNIVKGNWFSQAMKAQTMFMSFDSQSLLFSAVEKDSPLIPLEYTYQINTPDTCNATNVNKASSAMSANDYFMVLQFLKQGFSFENIARNMNMSVKVLVEKFNQSRNIYKSNER